MIKKLLLVLTMLVATMGMALADVDVNKADQAALDSVRGIGPKMSKSIMDERTKGGAFKDWPDFEQRMKGKGIGAKNSLKLSAAGLQVNGHSKDGAPSDPSLAKSGGSKAKPTAMAKATGDSGTK